MKDGKAFSTQNNCAANSQGDAGHNSDLLSVQYGVDVEDEVGMTTP